MSTIKEGTKKMNKLKMEVERRSNTYEGEFSTKMGRRVDREKNGSGATGEKIE
jgi:hypothetical protein